MAKGSQAVRKTPAFPGVGASRKPQQLPPGARQMMGVPITTVQPASKAGGGTGQRVTGSK